MDAVRNAYTILAGKPEKKRLSLRWDHDIKTDI
jgi:hypothetical protein